MNLSLLKFLFITLLLLFIIQGPLLAGTSLRGQIHSSHFFSFPELKELQKQDKLDPYLENKLKTVLNTAIVGETKYPAKRYLTKEDLTKRKHFNFTHWNLERGYKLHAIDEALNNSSSYIRENNIQDQEIDTDLLKEEINLLKDTQIYTINEADYGMARTDYTNTVEEFAKITQSKYYAFVPEFIEIDPKYLDQPDLKKHLYKALHGNAIVSKFPIRSTKVIPLEQCYDWMLGETEAISRLEKFKRKMSKVLFKTPIITELRRGQRNALLARIDVPNSPEDITIVVTHFENRCRPKCRKKQIKALLEYLKEVDTPLILSGDFNNSEVSAEPTSFTSIIKRTLTDWQNLARATVTWFNPLSTIINPSCFVLNTFRKAHDPTVPGLPILLRNKTADLFWQLINFEFNDGNMFDFSDAKKLCYKGRDGKLANSNQRVFKGFASTFKLIENNILAHFRFDWIFVKSMRIAGCQDNEDDFEDIKPECKHFIPAFGRNLSNLNYSYYRDYTEEELNDQHRDFSLFSLSDHDPITCKILI